MDRESLDSYTIIREEFALTIEERREGTTPVKPVNGYEICLFRDGT